MLLCASKDDEVVEYALARTTSPTLVAEYQTLLPPTAVLRAKLHELYAELAPLEPTRDDDRDRRPAKPVSVGWKGTDAAGPYACLASHPDRCWTGFGEEHAVTAQGDGSFALISLVSTNSSATFTVLRPIGTGNRPQPL